MKPCSFVGLILFSALASTAVAQSWTQLAPSGALPPGRYAAVGVYAPQSNKLMLFSGYTGNGDTNDLWILSGANGTGTSVWQQVIPNGAAGSPPAREAAAGVYDQTSNRMIIFGSVSYNDTWILINADGTTGTPQWVQQFPTNSPPAFNRSSAVYDPSTNRMIVFGGANGSGVPNNDTWVLTNANGTEATTPTWIKLSPSGTLPPTKSHHTAQYDSALNKMIVYGGEYDEDTWVLSNANGLGGTPAWTLLATSGQIPLQSVNALSGYDPQSQRFILFGGTAAITNFQQENSTYVLINAAGNGNPVWQPLSPAGTLPPPRLMPSGGYDVLGNRLIVFGGSPDGSTLLNDTWVLTNANGIVGSQLNVTQVFPNHGGNAGTTTVTLTGAGFQAGAQVNLTGLGTGIVGTNTQVLDAGFLETTFNLVGAPAGVGNIIVTNPDGTTATLAGAFTVEQGGAPQLWVDIVGRNQIRIGSNQTYYITYGNRGNVDSAPSVLSVVVPISIAFNVDPSQPLIGTLTSGSNNASAFALGSVPVGGVEAIPISLNTTSATNAMPTTTSFQLGAFMNLVMDLPAATGADFEADLPCSFYATCDSQCASQYNLQLQTYDLAKSQFDGYVNASTAETAALAQLGAQAVLAGAENAEIGLAVGALVAEIGLTSAGGAAGTAAEGYVSASITHIISATRAAYGGDTQTNVAEAQQASLDLASASAQNANLLNDLKNNPLTPKDAYLKAALLGAGIDFISAALTKFNSASQQYFDLSLERQSAYNFFTVAAATFCRARDAVESCHNSLGSSATPCGSPILPLPPTEPGDGQQTITITPVTSLDPNDKVGPRGFSAAGYLASPSFFRYSVFFQNQTIATAPAQAVTITDPIDASLNLTTLTLGPITFPNQVVTPPSIPLSAAPFATTVDLRPTTNLLVAITAYLNSATRTLTWTFQSLDPTTNQPPTDPLAGFLPPGAEGSVFLTAMPASTVTTGTVIQNTASIVFDANAAIATPTWTNTIDNTPPVSQVLALPPDESSLSFAVAWSGTDVGSGVQSYTIYVSDNGGPFTPWLTNTTGTSATYAGQTGHSYGFYSIATDNVGNVEAAKTAAEATTEVTAPTPVTPTLTVTLSSTSTTTTQSLNVTVAVSGGSGNPIPTGAVTLTSGGYTSASTALSGGAATITIPAGSLVVGTDTLTLTYTPDAASSSIYNSASGSASIMVQGYPVITWPTPPAITYGTPLSTTQLDATASVAGSFTYVPPSGTVLNAGSQTLGVTFNPTDTTDYLAVSANVTLLVNQASQVITFTGLPATATYGSAGPYTLSATGGASGNPVTYTATGPASIIGSTLAITGAGTVTVTASQAGNTNYMAATPVSQTILVGKATSTTVVSAVSTMPAQGMADLLTATVTGAGQQPSGTVQFMAGTTALCAITLNAGVATCSYVPTASGSVIVSAQYQGDANHQGSSASLTLTVYDAAISLKVRRTGLFYSERLEGEVCVTSAIRAKATGTVEILDGTTLLVTRELRRDGCAHWEDRSELSVGTHVLTAVYSGDNDNPAGISAPVTVTVNPAPVDLDVFCGKDRFPYGDNYDCKVSVHSQAGPAEGSITYSFDGGTAIPVPLSLGNADFTITMPTVGTHTVVVAYAQQTNYAAADPQTRDFTVTLAPVNVDLTFTPFKRTVQAGTNITFQADVTSSSAGPPNSTGVVSFFDGSQPLTTVPVNTSGQASYTTASLSLGYHTITATYSGGANYASGSNSVTITITH
jgi:hypothetical protein